LDLPMNVSTATMHIKTEVQRGGLPIEGQNSDARTYALACTLFDLGLSDAKILELLCEHWAPHFDTAWLESKIANASAYKQNENGCDAHSASIEEVFGDYVRSAEAQSEDKQARDDDEGFPIYEPWQFKDRPAPRDIVRMLLREKACHINFGKSESFKTF